MWSVDMIQSKIVKRITSGMLAFLFAATQVTTSAAPVYADTSTNAAGGTLSAYYSSCDAAEVGGPIVITSSNLPANGIIRGYINDNTYSRQFDAPVNTTTTIPPSVTPGNGAVFLDVNGVFSMVTEITGDPTCGQPKRPAHLVSGQYNCSDLVVALSSATPGKTYRVYWRASTQVPDPTQYFDLSTDNPFHRLSVATPQSMTYDLILRVLEPNGTESYLENGQYITGSIRNTFYRPQCIIAPQITTTAVCGANNDQIVDADNNTHYTITADTGWSGGSRTLTLQTIDSWRFDVKGAFYSATSPIGKTTTVTLTDSATTCPLTVTPCTTITGPELVTTKSQFADYAYQDTRADGHTEFTADGLRIWTTLGDSTSKVAWYKSVNYPLASVGAPTMEYTATNGIAPGLQLIVDFDNNGTPDGILVGESIYGNNWWLSNSAQQFVKDAAPHNGGGNGSQWFGTLDEWLTAFPSAQVKSVGFSLGSGVIADGVLTSLTFGCHKWTFGQEATPPAPATPLTIDKVDQDGKLLPGATFEGYSCTVWDNDLNWQCQSLNDYSWFNNDLTANGTTGSGFSNEIQMMNPTATKCSDPTVMHIVLLREVTPPAGYTGVNGWSVLCQTTHGWIADGGMVANVRLDGEQIEVPTILQPHVSSDGKTVTFKNLRIGQGGVDTPVVVTPTPVVTTAAATLPALLPHAGPTDTSTPKGLFLALTAAIATYGAVYFAQGKRRFEQ